MSAPEYARIRFLTMLGRALHSYGIPSHQLEEALTQAARRLDVRAEFLSTPTSLTAAYGEPGEQRVELVRVHPGELQLDKLVELDETTEALYAGEIHLEEADRRLQAIDSAPPRYGAVLSTIAFALVAPAACRFLGGGWREMAVALGVGLLGGFIGMLAGRFEGVARMQVMLYSVVASFAVAGVTRWTGPLATGEVILGALIILLPGLTLTTALAELSTGHLVAGTARFMGSLATFVQLALGVGIGNRLATLLPGEVATAAAQPLPEWTLWAMLLLTPLTLGILFRARPREIPWIVLGTLAAFWGARLGVAWMGPSLGTALGALLVGMMGNLYGRLRRKPAVVMVVPSIIVLVPGSIGYRSVDHLVNSDMMTGLDTAVTALVIGISLVAGLLLANVLLPARRAL